LVAFSKFNLSFFSLILAGTLWGIAQAGFFVANAYLGLTTGDIKKHIQTPGII
jgi:hypothetical protein